MHSNKSTTWVRKFNSDIKQIKCHNTNNCGGKILLLINAYFKKNFRGSEWKLPSPSTIPLRSTGDVKKEMTAKKRRRTLSYIPASSPSGRIPLMRIPLSLLPTPWLRQNFHQTRFSLLNQSNDEKTHQSVSSSHKLVQHFHIQVRVQSSTYNNLRA